MIRHHELKRQPRFRFWSQNGMAIIARFGFQRQIWIRINQGCRFSIKINPFLIKIDQLQSLLVKIKQFMFFFWWLYHPPTHPPTHPSLQHQSFLHKNEHIKAPFILAGITNSTANLFSNFILSFFHILK